MRKQNITNIYNSFDEKWKHILSYLLMNSAKIDMSFPLDWEDTKILTSEEVFIRDLISKIEKADISEIMFRIIQVDGNRKFLIGNESKCKRNLISLGKKNVKYLTAHELILEDLLPLQIFDKIKYLNLENIFVNNPNYLFELKELEILNIINSPIQNIRRLKSLTKLRNLKINNPYYGVDKEMWHDFHNKLIIFAEMENLRELELEGYWDFDRVQFLSNLTQLKSLKISYPLNLAQLELIKVLSNLEKLELNVPEDMLLSETMYVLVRSLPKLKHLNITRMNPYKDIMTQAEEFEFIMNFKLIDIE